MPQWVSKIKHKIEEQWAEGERHGFPRCCRIRFIVDSLRPSLTHWILPKGVASRVQRMISPRLSVADGMVPCEYHLLKYLLTGDRTSWRKALPPGMCCQMRKDLVHSGIIFLSRESYENEDPGGMIAESEISVWLFGTNQEDLISITHCPYCGKDLEEA